MLPILFFLPGSQSIAQISHSFELDYAGTILKGNIEVEVKIAEKDQDSRNRPLTFSNNKIKANVSKFKNPVFIVEFSKLNFEAPVDLAKKLSLNIVPPAIPKGFKQNLQVIYEPLKVREKRSFSYEIPPADTVLTGELKFQFSAIVIGKRSFKIENNSLQISFNIIPPPLFPEDATERELWKTATKLNTVKAYKIYIERFPEGRSVQEAKQMQRELIRNPEKYPPDQITTNIPVLQKNEKREWQKVKSTKSIVAYNDFLKDFPESQHAQEAQLAVKSLLKPLDTLILKTTAEELMGRLIYHIQDTMTIGQTYRVRLEISADTSSHFIEKLIANVEEFSDHPEELNTEIIQIGKTMRAKLEESNPEAERYFYIHLFGESNEREVNLYSSKSTIWEWDVTPLKEGRHPLSFTIEIITIKDGIEKPEVLPVYDSKITILSRSLFQAYKVQFISGGIILALLVVILLLFLKKKRASTEQKDLEKLIKNHPLEGAIALIEEDKLKEALDVLDIFLKHKDEELFQEIILLKSRLSGNTNNLNKAIISNEDATTELNNIKLSTLDVVTRSKAIK